MIRESNYFLYRGEVLPKEGFEEIIRYIRNESNRRGFSNPIVLISNGLKMNEEYFTSSRK